MIIDLSTPGVAVPLDRGEVRGFVLARPGKRLTTDEKCAQMVPMAGALVLLEPGETRGDKGEPDASDEEIGLGRRVTSHRQ